MRIILKEIIWATSWMLATIGFGCLAFGPLIFVSEFHSFSFSWFLGTILYMLWLSIVVAIILNNTKDKCNKFWEWTQK